MYSNMSDFYERVIKPSMDAEARIAELGGLPEITAAAGGLKEAIDHTRVEIEDADFASRFLPTRGENFVEMTKANPITRLAVEQEGERGLKREQLRHDLMGVEADVMSAIHRLVQLRADLAISQIEF
jgi:hypothetical protein